MDCGWSTPPGYPILRLPTAIPANAHFRPAWTCLSRPPIPDRRLDTTSVALVMERLLA
jgi:hypothetical protein